MNKYLKKAIAITEKKILSKVLSNYKINYRNRGVINFIDVGSIGGLPEPWHRNAHFIKFLLNFEPNDTIKIGENFMTYNTVIWEKEEIKPFFIYKGLRGTGSSLFEQNYKYVTDNIETLKLKGNKRLAHTWFDRSQLVRQINVQCETLDSVVNKKFSTTQFHFIKIDAQGAEYNILNGAFKVLENCVGLHLELFNLPLYKDIALRDQVVSFLSNLDFELVRVYPSHGTFDSQNDCLFINKKFASHYTASIIKKVYRL